MQLIFVLFEPQVPENVGAAARALNTMGFDQLRVVGSDAHLQPAASWVAHGSDTVLEQVTHFDDLDSALADCDLVVGTTAKHRAGYRDVYEPEQLRKLISSKRDSLTRVALLFGREDRGLSNDELERCDLLSSIPLANPYPSLNLGQAVMLFAYSLTEVTSSERHLKPSANQEGQLRALRQRTASLADAVGYPQDSKLQRWMQERLGQLNSEDIRFLHSLCAALEQRLDKR
ncbi:tRNA/rRNA methyltransferase [Motiliproteus sp.]|uniref:tRNA/rRNA methyltransferase n=1 Tax=Motiliproteus sp. TaxID=1898955 RepID=UPI003BAB9363